MSDPQNPQIPLVMLDPQSIGVDAATYQFRSGGNGNGVTKEHRINGDRWDPILHGDPILVHERLDGSLFVADGHHRLDLAQRLNPLGKGPGKIAAMVLREADGYTPEDVRVIAAYKNMAHGSSNPIDGARVFQEAESGRVHHELLPQLQMDKTNLRISYSLSKLSEPALERVASGEIPIDIGTQIAEKFADRQSHSAVMDYVMGKIPPIGYMGAPTWAKPVSEGFGARILAKRQQAAASGYGLAG